MSREQQYLVVQDPTQFAPKFTAWQPRLRAFVAPSRKSLREVARVQQCYFAFAVFLVCWTCSKNARPFDEQTTLFGLEREAVSLLDTRFYERDPAEHAKLDTLAPMASTRPFKHKKPANRRFNTLMAAAEEAREDQHDTDAEQKRNRGWNLRRLEARVEAVHNCTLCHKPAGGAWLRCEKESKGRSGKRVGGHVTCFPCLQQRQGVSQKDIIRGVSKVRNAS